MPDRFSCTSTLKPPSPSGFASSVMALRFAASSRESWTRALIEDIIPSSPSERRNSDCVVRKTGLRPAALPASRSAEKSTWAVMSCLTDALVRAASADVPVMRLEGSAGAGVGVERVGFGAVVNRENVAALQRGRRFPRPAFDSGVHLAPEPVGQPPAEPGQPLAYRGRRGRPQALGEPPVLVQRHVQFSRLAVLDDEPVNRKGVQQFVGENAADYAGEGQPVARNPPNAVALPVRQPLAGRVRRRRISGRRRNRPPNRGRTR